MADCLNRGVVDCVLMDSYAQHIANYPPRATCRKLLPSLGAASIAGYDSSVLVCSLRGGEVLRNAHPNYLVLPPHFYRTLAETTGLDLVFYGQVGEDAYTNSLRAALPDARFVTGQGPLHDFEVLRRSANLVPSISTFAWLAAWLSDADQVILPVCGFINPVQSSLMNFLPLGDPAFSYWLFPIAHAVDLFQEPHRFMTVQENLARDMRRVSNAELLQIRDRAASKNRPQALLSGFDLDFYLSLYPDVRGLVERGVASAAEHYVQSGFHESRFPFPMDEAYYFANYRDAALAVMDGRYDSAIQHYGAVGYGAGYRYSA